MSKASAKYEGSRKLYFEGFADDTGGQRKL